ncbi:MAG: class I SAM-dependent methyltransferase [Planctomycetes bacterium]|nr:class I SAM-dependent methyltransferase [Planctomycetota bacterium]
MTAPAPRRALTARTADRHALYTAAVQAPARDAAFFARHYEKLVGEPLRTLREDFCGTAALACSFVRRHRDNRAIGVDGHAPTLGWGLLHHAQAWLDEGQQQRLSLVCADVRAVHRPQVQMLVATNFSYMVFHTRPGLLGWLRNCHRSLRRGGVLLLDVWGGGLVQRALVERHRGAGFDWLWQQRAFDPVSHRIDCRIHFVFRDGSMLRDAFVYDWRLWTLPELRELLAEAGFTGVQVLFEQARRPGRRRFVARAVGRADPAWYAYVVGRKAGSAR